MNFLRKNIAIVACVMSLLIIILSFVGIINVREKETLYVKAIKGNRSVLNDIVISGFLQDKYHGQNFTINDGEILKKFIYYDKYTDLIASTLRPMGNVLYDGGVQYSYNVEGGISKDSNVSVIEKPAEEGKNKIINGKDAQSDAYQYINEITYADKIDFFVNLYRRNASKDQQMVKANTGVKNKSALKEFEFKKTYYKFYNNGINSKELVSSGGSSYRLPARTNNENSAFTFINGKLYFTVLSDKSASGDNGIFTVDKWSTWPNWKNETEYGETTKITTFNLDKHNTDVLGIENVKDKLILYMLIDDVLTFRAYDPKNGELIDELKVKDFKRDKINGNYQVFVNDDVLSIHFNEEANFLVSIKLGKAFTLEHLVKGLELSNENNPIVLENVTTINNKLFVFCYVTDKDENSISIEALKKNHFMLFVYDKTKPYSKLLVKSEIMTDADQDKEYDRQKNLNSYAYGMNDTRRFYGIEVKSK